MFSSSSMVMCIKLHHLKLLSSLQRHLFVFFIKDIMIPVDIATFSISLRMKLSELKFMFHAVNFMLQNKKMSFELYMNIYISKGSIILIIM